MNKSDLADRYQLLHLVHQSYLGALWASKGLTGDATNLPALVRKIQLPVGLSEDQQASIAEAAWDSLELTHDSLLKVAEVVFAEGIFAVVYDYVEAEVLQALLLMGTVKKTPLAPDVVARILLDVVDGLDALTAQTKEMDINAHGGVTPESILVGSDGRAQWIDSVVGAVASTFAQVRSNPNRVGYCAPEQLKGGSIDERSDVFSLAVLVAELLAGRRLLLGAAEAIEQKIAEGKLPRINGWLKPERGIENKLLDVLDKALSLEPGKRQAHPRAFAEEVCDAVASPASRAQVGAAVYGLAAKQIEVRARKLGLHTGPRLSDRVVPARTRRSTPSAPLPTATLPGIAFKAPRSVDTRNLSDAEPPSRPRMVTFTGLAPAPQQRGASANGAGEHQTDAAEIDALLDNIDAQVTDKPDDMQSGTHRKVLNTLIGVAPPPKPMIGGPPPLAIPTQVTVATVATPPAAPVSSSKARDAAGIADLLRTSVPAKRDATQPADDRVPPSRPGGRAAAGVTKEIAKPIPVSVTDSSVPPESSALTQLQRYQRLTILFGATTVLLLTVLCWLVLEGAALNVAPPPASRPTVASPAKVLPPPVSPPASATPPAAAAAAGAPAQVEEAPIGAEQATVEKAPAAARVRAPTVQKRAPKKKIYVPDDI